MYQGEIESKRVQLIIYLNNTAVDRYLKLRRYKLYYYYIDLQKKSIK